jgi:hypothetical protein
MCDLWFEIFAGPNVRVHRARATVVAAFTPHAALRNMHRITSTCSLVLISLQVALIFPVTLVRTSLFAKPRNASTPPSACGRVSELCGFDGVA